MKLQLRTDDGELLAEQNATERTLDWERNASDAIGSLLREIGDPETFIQFLNENAYRDEYGLVHQNGMASYVFYRVIDGTLYKAVGGKTGRKRELIQIDEATDFDVNTPPGKVWVYRVKDFSFIPWNAQCPDCGRRGLHRGSDNTCHLCVPDGEDLTRPCIS